MLKKIPLSIFSLVIASLLTSISVSMVFSISPFFMTKTLGLSMLAMGAVEGLTEGISQMSKMLSGWISDKMKRKKPVLLVGFVLSAISKPLFILSTGFPLVLLSKILERLTNGLIATARDAFVIDNSPASLKGACLGLMLTSKTLGCVLGSFFVSFALLYTQDYQVILWVGFIMAVTAALILGFFVHEPVPKEIEKQKFSINDMKDLSRGYWIIIAIASVFMCGRFTDGFMILKLNSIGASPSLSAATIGILNIVSSLCCFPIGKLSDTFSRSKLLYFAFISLFLSHSCFYFSDNLNINVLGIMLWGAQRGTSQILFSAIISDLVPSKILGTAIGINYLITGIVSLTCGVVSGKLADLDIHYAFLFGLIVSFIALICLMIRNNTPVLVRAR